VAVAVLYEFQGMTQEHYDRFIEDAYQGRQMPGVISHAAGPTSDGWWAFDVYDSQGFADAIGSPAIGRLKEMGIAEPHVRTFQVHISQTG
jgi:hypothetical protein